MGSENKLKSRNGRVGYLRCSHKAETQVRVLFALQLFDPIVQLDRTSVYETENTGSNPVRVTTQIIIASMV